jgi:Mn-dependent DtxR family transcriptional regulator
MSGETEALHELIDFENDFKWFLKESEKIKEKYRGKVLLIKNKEIKVIGNTIEEIREKAKKMNIDISKSVVQFVPKEEITLII